VTFNSPREWLVRREGAVPFRAAMAADVLAMLPERHRTPGGRDARPLASGVSGASQDSQERGLTVNGFEPEHECDYPGCCTIGDHFAVKSDDDRDAYGRTFAERSNTSARQETNCIYCGKSNPGKRHVYQCAAQYTAKFEPVTPRAKKRRLVRDTEKVTYVRTSQGEGMKITAVRYERVCSMGKGTYETERIAAEAQVDEGESAEAVLLGTKRWVNEQLGLDDDLSPDEIARMERKLERAKRRERTW
jgi:hypothetical protein